MQSNLFYNSNRDFSDGILAQSHTASSARFKTRNSFLPKSNYKLWTRDCCQPTVFTQSLAILFKGYTQPLKDIPSPPELLDLIF